MKRILSILLWSLAVTTTWAQGPPAGVTMGGRPIEVDAESSSPDTFVMEYFYLDEPSVRFPYKDTVLHSLDHQPDPARRTEVDYLHLGNQGSAAAPQRYEARPFIGFHEGHTQYDLYKVSRDNFRFYEGNSPMANLSFSPHTSQDNFIITADFYRDFGDGFTISTNYQRIYQDGTYGSQRTEMTNLGVSVRYQKPLSKYTAYMTIISNVADEDNSGGPASLADLTTFGRGNRGLIPPTLAGANTRYQQKEYTLTNYYKLNSKYSQLDLLLRYDVGLDFSYYKYSDPDASTARDTTYYGPLLAVDDRGIRQRTDIGTVSNAFYVYLTDKKKLSLRAGIVYDRHSVDREIDRFTYHNVYLTADGTVPFYKGLSLDTKAQLGIGDGAGDFNVDASLALDVGTIGTLRGGVGLYRHSAPLLAQSLFLTQTPVWDNTLTKPVGSDLYGTLEIPYLRLKAELHQHLVTNAIYFDTLAQPQQYDDIYSATTLTLTNDIKYGIWHLENSVLLQLINENIYGLPTLWTHHHMFLEFPMFHKNMLARWGVETRLAPNYDGLTYQPAVGVFHLSGSQQVFYPMTDVYFSGKVQTFRLFVKLENLNQLINSSNVDFRVGTYPADDWRIRFGVSWLFLG